MDPKQKATLTPWSRMAQTLEDTAGAVVDYLTPNGQEAKAENQKIGQGIKSKIDAEKAAAFKKGFEGN